MREGADVSMLLHDGRPPRASLEWPQRPGRLAHAWPDRAARAQVTYLVGVQLDVTAPGSSSAEPVAAPAPPIALLRAQQVCGAVRVACRALCPVGLRRSACDQILPSPATATPAP